MVPAAKVGLVVVAGAAGITGSYFLITGSDPMPTYSTLAGIADLSAYGNKIGQDYSHFLIAPDAAENKSWWEWSYRRWEKDSSGGESGLSELFKRAKIKKTDDETKTDAKTLNKVCDDLYKKTTADISFEEPTEGNEKDKRLMGRNLMRYCSHLGEVPKPIGDGSTYGEGTIGAANKNDLVSASDGSNGDF